MNIISITVGCVAYSVALVILGVLVMNWCLEYTLIKMTKDNVKQRSASVFDPSELKANQAVLNENQIQFGEEMTRLINDISSQSDFMEKSLEIIKKSCASTEGLIKDTLAELSAKRVPGRPRGSKNTPKISIENINNLSHQQEEIINTMNGLTNDIHPLL